MDREVERAMDSAFTVRQLIEELQDLDPESRVFFVCSYGDYHRTPQALPVSELTGDLSTDDLAETAYSQSNVRLVEKDDEEDDENEEQGEQFPIVVLRS